MLLRPVGDAPEVVTLAEAKAHLRVGFDDENENITGLIGAATEWAAKVTGLSLGEREWELVSDGFPIGCLRLPVVPLISVEAVTYTDTLEAPQTYSGFRVFGVGGDTPGYVLPAVSSAWPDTSDEPESVTVEFTAGSAAIPKPIKQAILLLVGHWYENRESASPYNLSEVPFGVSALLLPHRNWG
ncbi:head-tail connector protein [Bosea sp. LjRoot237]|uniref:head-tail connector protein n=1 Tax=Bosea sp. LjRoot237 TaxID=3342292 RepID=UPI003ED0ADF1